MLYHEFKNYYIQLIFTSSEIDTASHDFVLDILFIFVISKKGENVSEYFLYLVPIINIIWYRRLEIL